MLIEHVIFLFYQFLKDFFGTSQQEMRAEREGQDMQQSARRREGRIEHTASSESPNMNVVWEETRAPGETAAQKAYNTLLSVSMLRPDMQAVAALDNGLLKILSLEKKASPFFPRFI